MKKANNTSTIRKTGLGAKASRRLGNTLIYILLITITIVWLFPFVGIVLESFEVSWGGMDKYLIPRQWGLDNYTRLFTQTGFPKWFLNTAIMGVACAIFQMVS